VAARITGGTVGGVSVERGISTPRKGSHMSKETESLVKPASTPASLEHAPLRKPYDSPHLQEWGSLLELTKGQTGGEIFDADFGGSEAV
jgi:hypothetical protein